MRIAIVSPYDLAVPGGVQSHVRLLAAALRRAGDRVVVVGAGTPGVGRPDGGVAEVTVGSSRGVAFNGSVAPIALSPAAARRTRAVLTALAPDVVHVHEPLVPMVGLAAATQPATPRVLTFHAWSDRSRAYRAARPLARRVLDAADRAIAVSPAAAGYHARALGVDAGEQLALAARDRIVHPLPVLEDELLEAEEVLRQVRRGVEEEAVLADLAAVGPQRRLLALEVG
ncbi:MAG: glycosyltransferase family 4 protein, partial [Nitriliruptoraceae bacterium]